MKSSTPWLTGFCAGAMAMYAILQGISPPARGPLPVGRGTADTPGPHGPPAAVPEAGHRTADPVGNSGLAATADVIPGPSPVPTVELASAPPANRPDESDKQAGQEDPQARRHGNEAGRAPTRLPDAYLEAVQPRPRPLSVPELHQAFSNDPRDDSWAYAMELGINNHLAAEGAPEGTVIEYAECRSRFCELAGYVQPGFEDRSRELFEAMSGTGWWQLSSSTFTFGAPIDGVNRFVTIVPRWDEYAIEPPEREDSATRSIAGHRRDAF